jgi:mRNA interferase RelE/StbE
MYRILFNKQSRKALLKMPREISSSIRKKLDEIAINPFESRTDVMPLKGRPAYRLRVGRWRVIYKAQKETLEIVVIKVASRGDVYK